MCYNTSMWCRKYPEKRICLYCKNCFETIWPKQKFCNPKCRYKFWCKNNPEREKQIRKKSKHKRKEEIREAGCQYYTLNKEKILQRGKEWRKKHPKLSVQAVLNRYYKKRGAKGSHTLQEWEDLKKKFNYTCLICKRKEPEIRLTRDHKIPITKWNKWIKEHLEISYQCSDIQNIQPLCDSCNCRKFNHI